MKHFSFATSSAAHQESLKAEKNLFYPFYFLPNAKIESGET